MRWYFAIDEGGAQGETGQLARLAVRSARAVGGLEPVMLYHGAHGEFCAWMAGQGVRIVDTRPSFWDVVEQAKAAGLHQPLTIGHWLRVMIPLIETDHDYVLYTDCDVIFLRHHDWAAYKPRIFAAAPEFLQDNWNYFNSGVMLLHVPALRATWPGFEAEIKSRLLAGGQFRYDDQLALNESYRGHWQRLPSFCNHKPYWDFDPRAPLLHFHGPKPGVLEPLARRAIPAPDATMQVFEKMLAARADSYLAWCRYLGDHLQAIDISQALRFAHLASSLTAYRRSLPALGDASFMNIKLFAE